MGSLRDQRTNQEIEKISLPYHHEYQTEWQQTWQGRKVLVIMWAGAGIAITQGGNDIVIRLDICKPFKEEDRCNWRWRPTVIEKWALRETHYEEHHQGTLGMYFDYDKRALSNGLRGIGFGERYYKWERLPSNHSFLDR
jgi:hypothetical protein